MSEVRIGDVPIPLVNYIYLIKRRKSPYYDIVQHILKDMEIYYKRSGRSSAVIYTINPRILQDQIEKKVEKREKLTTVNICRTIQALMYGSKLRREDEFYVTTTSRGRRNYHIKVNAHTLGLMHRFI